jgi:hypothetical protein
MNFFLVDVWKQSKLIFVFFVVFILGTIWTTYWKSEVTPFFLWAHYSERKVPTGKFNRIYIQVNGEILDLPKLTRPTREIIQLPTEYFVQLEGRSYQTSTRHVLRKYLKERCPESLYSTIENRLVASEEDRGEYLRWLARYIERVLDMEVEEILVGSCELVFQEDRTVKRVNIKPIARLSGDEVQLR